MTYGRRAPAAEVWACVSPSQPEFTFYFGSDQSGGPFQFDCQKLDHAPAGVGASSWYRFWKVLRLLDPGLPPL